MSGLFFAQIAQSVEQGTENPRVDGSIPSLGTRRRGYPVSDDLFFFYLILSLFLQFAYNGFRAQYFLYNPLCQVYI